MITKEVIVDTITEIIVVIGTITIGAIRTVETIEIAIIVIIVATGETEIAETTINNLTNKIARIKIIIGKKIKPKFKLPAVLSV